MEEESSSAVRKMGEGLQQFKKWEKGGFFKGGLASNSTQPLTPCRQYTPAMIRYAANDACIGLEVSPVPRPWFFRVPSSHSVPTSPAFQFARVHQFNADLFPLYTHVLALLKSGRSQLALRRSASLSSRISQMGCVRVHFVGALLGAPLPVFVSFDRVRF